MTDPDPDLGRRTSDVHVRLRRGAELLETTVQVPRLLAALDPYVSHRPPGPAVAVRGAVLALDFAVEGATYSELFQRVALVVGRLEGCAPELLAGRMWVELRATGERRS